MKINTDHLNRCITTLRDAWEGLRQREPGDVLYAACCAACIDQFELVLEQSGKLMKKRLRPYFASNRQADRLYFNDVFRHAAKHDLISIDICQRWLEYRASHNRALQEPGARSDEATLELLPRFIADAQQLASAIAAPTTERLHLKPEHRRMLDELLRRHAPAAEVWAYGSRVSGRSHDGSDLDLVLRAPGLKEIPIGQLVDLEEAVRLSTIPFLVEARDWARLPQSFCREIERAYVALVPARPAPALESGDER